MGINLGSTAPTPSAPLGAATANQMAGGGIPAAAPPVTPPPAAAPTTPPAGAEAVALPGGGVTLNLSKNTMLDLTKRNPGLSKVKLGAGWDIAQGGADFDLDISAFLLGVNGKIASTADVVFFNNMNAPGVRLNGDNRTGAGEGDDETIDIDLSAISPNVQRIVFCVTIADAAARMQTFGMVQNSYVRLMDAAQGDKEICRFVLKDDYATATAMIFAELERSGNEWNFKTVGEGKQGDLNTLAGLYS